MFDSQKTLKESYFNKKFGITGTEDVVHEGKGAKYQPAPQRTPQHVAFWLAITFSRELIIAIERPRFNL